MRSSTEMHARQWQTLAHLREKASEADLYELRSGCTGMLHARRGMFTRMAYAYGREKLQMDVAAWQPEGGLPELRAAAVCAICFGG